jgi:hypothetical protein
MTGGPGKIKIDANVYLLLQVRKIKVETPQSIFTLRAI